MTVMTPLEVLNLYRNSNDLNDNYSYTFIPHYITEDGTLWVVEVSCWDGTYHNHYYCGYVAGLPANFKGYSTFNDAILAALAKKFEGQNLPLQSIIDYLGGQIPGVKVGV